MKNITLTKSGDYRVEILNPGDEISIVGMFHGKNDDDININLTIVHKAPHTRAKTILKGVAEDKSHIRFFGRIIIEEDCGDTQSFLEERILLLSDKAKAEAIPELEIKTDDVKCSHAASISRIPEEHLFYLESRGIPQKLAEDMIVEGFLE
ncbi:MAG: SufD family Fe-S cluster assembly protein [Candidatus Woesebacteria bacterium]